MHTMTVKGQVTVPKAMRDKLGLKPGSLVAFVENAAGEVVVRAGDDATERARLEGEARVARFDAAIAAIAAVAGSVNIGMTTDEFMATIREPLPDPIDQP